jgi:hypothetical protein
MTRSSISMFLLVVGLLWAAIVSWTFLALGGAAELTFAYLSKTLLLYSWMFIGPLLLIAGAILSLGTHRRVGSILSLIGCAILTVMVGYQSISMLRDLADPLIMKPPYGKWAMGIILTLLADAGAVQLYRLTPLASRISL